MTAAAHSILSLLFILNSIACFRKVLLSILVDLHWNLMFAMKAWIKTRCFSVSPSIASEVQPLFSPNINLRNLSNMRWRSELIAQSNKLLFPSSTAFHWCLEIVHKSWELFRVISTISELKSFRDWVTNRSNWNTVQYRAITSFAILSKVLQATIVCKIISE